MWANSLALRGGIGSHRRKLLKQAQAGPEGIASLSPMIRRLRSGLSLSDQLAVLPKAERVAVRIDEIGQRLEFFPLLFVVRVFELARVGAFSRCLQFNEPGQRLVNRHCIVRARLEVAD